MNSVTDNQVYQLPPGSRWRRMVFWDPVLGCSPKSSGCLHCSSARALASSSLVTWRNGEPHFNGTVEWDEEAFSDVVFFDDNEQVFVCGRSDLFHEKIPELFIHKVVQTAATRPDCTFFALTKRPERMYTICKGVSIPPNFWIGITVEEQKYAQRLKYFDDIDCVKVVSAKPLLGPLVLEYWGSFDMVVVGGEYTLDYEKARPCHIDWVRSLRDQCLIYNKPFSFHNWGSWLPGGIKHTNDNENQYLLDGVLWDEYPQIKGENDVNTKESH